MEKKKNKGLIITIIILVILLLGLASYIAYDKLYQTKEETNQPVETTEEIKEEEPKESTTSTSNSFSLFAQAVKENRAKQKEKDTKEGITSEITDYFIANHGEDFSYGITLDYDGTLSVVYSNEKFQKYDATIDTNVLFYERVSVGNGGFCSLYYVKEDGKVYEIGIEYDIYEGTTPKSELVKGYQDIIMINEEAVGDSRGGGGHGPVFTDINGNIYYSRAS